MPADISSPNPSPNHRAWLGNVSVLVVTLGLLWGGGEIVLRSLEGRSDDTPMYTSSPDPYVIRLRPDITAWRNGVEIRTNAIGARGGPLSDAPPSDEYRIACVGDSYLFGTGVEEERTIPSVLSRILESTLDRPVEAINLGIEGANAYDNMARIQHIALPQAPDAVIMFFLFNDVFHMERGLDWMAARRDDTISRDQARRAHERWQNKSYVWRYLAPRLAGLARNVLGRNTGRLAVWDRQFEPDVPAWQATQTAIETARSSCRDSGVAFGMALLPSFAVFQDGKYPLATYRARMLEWCGAEGIPVVDLHEPFWGEVGRRYWINPLDPHPNAEACERMAAHVADWLVADENFLGMKGK